MAAHPVLRWPLFPVAPQAEEREFWIEPAHPLHALEPDETLDLIGPAGAGLRWGDGLTRLLLVGAAPVRLLPLMQAMLARGGAVAWLWPEAVPEWAAGLLPPAVEFHTGAASAELVDWTEMAVLDVPDPAPVAARLRALAPLKPAHFIHAFHLPPMPCGTGACQACWVPARHGRKLACVEGPVVTI